MTQTYFFNYLILNIQKHKEMVERHSVLMDIDLIGKLLGIWIEESKNFQNGL